MKVTSCPELVIQTVFLDQLLHYLPKVKYQRSQNSAVVPARNSLKLQDVGSLPQALEHFALCKLNQEPFEKIPSDNTQLIQYFSQVTDPKAQGRTTQIQRRKIPHELVTTVGIQPCGTYDSILTHVKESKEFVQGPSAVIAKDTWKSRV